MQSGLDFKFKAWPFPPIASQLCKFSTCISLVQNLTTASQGPAHLRDHIPCGLRMLCSVRGTASGVLGVLTRPACPQLACLTRTASIVLGEVGISGIRASREYHSATLLIFSPPSAQLSASRPHSDALVVRGSAKVRHQRCSSAAVGGTYLPYFLLTSFSHQPTSVDLSRHGIQLDEHGGSEASHDQIDHSRANIVSSVHQERRFQLTANSSFHTRIDSAGFRRGRDAPGAVSD